MFTHPQADIFVPDGLGAEEALRRTTHLCVGAHQDDLEIFAYHGIAECFGRADKWFCGVVATNGAGSPRAGLYADTTDEEMQEVRRREQRKAAVVGEYGAQVQLAHPSSAAKSPSVPGMRQDLEKIFDLARPEVVYLHNPADKHDTHVAVLHRCLEALRALPAEARPAKAYGCEVWRGLDWLLDEDKVLLPSGAYNNIAAALVAVFDSQISGGKRYDLATAGRRLANATYHASHAVDAADAITWALDLKPLLDDPELSLADYTAGFVERLAADVRARVEKFA